MLSLLIVFISVLFVLVVLSATSDSSASTHPFNVHDLVMMDRLSDVQPAPDGSRLVFGLRSTDLDANKGRNDLYVVDPDGSNLRRLTTHPAGSSHPRWAPDGSCIYFLSSRNETTQVWSIAPDGGEAQPVTSLPLDVNCFAVSPDGRHLAVGVDVFPDAATLEDTKIRLDEEAERPSTGKLYSRLFVRHWDTWKDGRRSHLLVVPATPDSGATPMDVMRDMDADAPSKPFGGAEEFTFTPDSRSLVFAARNVGREEAWSTHFDLFITPIDGSEPPQVLVPGHGATITNPVFSPDGKTLAYLAMQRPGFEADRFRIAVMAYPGGEPRMLTEAWDRSPGSIHYSADGGTIFTAADELGHHPLFAINSSTGAVRTVVDQGKVTSIAVLADRIVYGWCHHQSPTELHTVTTTGQGAAPITHLNADRLAAVRMGDAEQVTFRGWNDETVHAWVVKPIDFDAGRTYPVAFLIHGGPQGSFGADFHYRWNPQVYAGAGYAAVMIDFHGSTGYGQDFTDAISGHWGDRPFEDLQKGLAAVLEQYPWMDGKRVAALGASFGGYMINWIAGNWPDRFTCLVNHDGNIDERMAYYDTEELWFPEWERGGTPWENADSYGHHNPIDHVDKWQTPMLVIHGGRDFRVVDTQGLSTFTALQRKSVPSQFLYFPDENHWVLKPHNSIQWHETVITWLDRWTKG